MIVSKMFYRVERRSEVELENQYQFKSMIFWRKIFKTFYIGNDTTDFQEM